MHSVLALMHLTAPPTGAPPETAIPPLRVASATTTAVATIAGTTASRRARVVYARSAAIRRVSGPGGGALTATSTTEGGSPSKPQ